MKIIILVFTALLSAQAFSAGFDEHYETYYGDFDNDALVDIYIKQKPQIILLHGDVIIPILLPPDVDEFVLKQTPDSTFVIVTDLSTFDISEAKKAPVELVISDFTLDGYNDLLIKGINNIPNIPANIDDHIVYAPGTSTPIALKAVDAKFKQFFREIHSWMLNFNYFEDNAPELSIVSTQYEAMADAAIPAALFLAACNSLHNNNCDLTEAIPFLWMPANLGRTCFDVVTEAYLAGDLSTGENLEDTLDIFCNPLAQFYIIHRQETETVKDYSGYNQDAIEAADIDRNVLLGQASVSDIVTIFERVLGNVILGEEIPGYYDTFDPTIPEDDYRDNQRLNIIVARVTNPFTFTPDAVVVRARLVAAWLGRPERHLSVHSPASLPRQWLSAFASNSLRSLFIDGGVLESEKSEERDAADAENIIVGHVPVVSPYPGSLVFWQALNLADDRYSDELTYCLYPERGKSFFGLSCNGYNSNSYAMGLIQSTGAAFTEATSSLGIQFNVLTNTKVYPGVTKPVPANEF